MHLPRPPKVSDRDMQNSPWVDLREYQTSGPRLISQTLRDKKSDPPLAGNVFVVVTDKMGRIKHMSPKAVSQKHSQRLTATVGLHKANNSKTRTQPFDLTRLTLSNILNMMVKGTGVPGAKTHHIPAQQDWNTSPVRNTTGYFP